MIRRAGAGFVCSPEDPRALADAVAQVSADPDRARAMGLSGRRYVEAHLTRTVAIDRLADAVEALGAASARRRTPR